MVLTLVFPAHTRRPIASIVTHSHKVKRMNRKAKSTSKMRFIQYLTMFDTEIFKIYINMPNLSKFSECFHYLSASLDFVSLSSTIFFIANFKVTSFPSVVGKKILVNQRLQIPIIFGRSAKSFVKIFINIFSIFSNKSMRRTN